MLDAVTLKSLVPVGDSVVSFLPVDELDLNAGHGGTHPTHTVVSWLHAGARASGLSHRVTLTSKNRLGMFV